jgi:hypothetical protein
MNTPGKSKKMQREKWSPAWRPPPQLGPLEAKSVLADTCKYIRTHHVLMLLPPFFSYVLYTPSTLVIPENKKMANLALLQARWECDTAWVDKANNADYDRFDQDNVIIKLAKNFIPPVQCLCNKGSQNPPPHGDGLYMVRIYVVC